MKSRFATRKFLCLVHQILKQHTLAIITAVVSSIALSQPSQAKVVYTPANIVIRNNTFSLDLNNDGIVDFSIPESEVHGLCLGASPNFTASLNVTPTQGNGIVGSERLAAALNAGVPIGPNRGMYSETELQMAHVKIGGFENFGHCSPVDIELGNWLNVTDRYLGLAFLIDGKYHFGWARLSVQFRVLAGHYFFTATLTGYAYETIAGKVITAGQTGDSDDSTASLDSSNQVISAQK